MHVQFLINELKKNSNHSFLKKNTQIITPSKIKWRGIWLIEISTWLIFMEDGDLPFVGLSPLTRALRSLSDIFSSCCTFIVVSISFFFCASSSFFFCSFFSCWYFNLSFAPCFKSSCCFFWYWKIHTNPWINSSELRHRRWKKYWTV